MCALYIHRSNRLEALAQLLVETMRLSPNPDPMIPEHVVIGNRGMREWLGRGIAEELGIASNISFEYPGRWFSRSFALRGIAPEGADPWQPDALVWAVLAAFDELRLDEPGHDAPLEILSDYLRRGGPPIVTRRRYQLARQVADLFDRYVVYRPDWVLRWSKGEFSSGELERFGWQPVVFQAVQKIVGDDRPHLAERIARLGGVESGDGDGTVHFFGLSGLPPVYVDALSRLSSDTDAHLYLLSPTPFFRERRSVDGGDWSELVNPLLASFGAWTQGVEELLEDRLHSRADAPIRDESALYVTPTSATGSETALTILQRGVLEQTGPASQPADRPALPETQSIQVHACYGALRQVEVLRDILLDRLDADPTLEPRDIIVMTPNIERYAPLVLAVFDQGWRNTVNASWGPTGAPRLPVRIVDRAMRRINPIADAILRTLALVGSRFEAPDVFDLLSLPPVAARLDLGESELSTIESWIAETGARWGWDADDRASFDQPRIDAFTWKEALDRLAFGATMMDAGDAPYGLVPWEHLEGDALSLFGRFGSAVEFLGMARRELSAPRTLADWASALVGDDESGGVLGALIDEEALSSWQGRQVRDVISALTEDVEASERQSPVEREALLAHLTGKMQAPSPVADDGPGSITVGSLVPARSVPFRVVVLLGMDDADFPRRPRELGFDLMREERRAGDRDPRDEDRHLFLESLLAARESWIALYSSRDDRTNDERFPSSPLAELIDVVDVSFTAPDGASSESKPSNLILRHHPLHGTDPRVFGIESPTRVFDLVRARAASTDDGMVEPIPFISESLEQLELDEELSLETLLSALTRPSAFFLNKRLGIRPLIKASELPTREMIEPDALERWKIGVAALDVNEELIEERLRGEGFVPPGTPGTLEVERAAKLARSLGAAFQQFAPDGIEALPVRVRFGERWLTASLPVVPGQSTIVMHMRGKPRAKRRLQLALHWMIARLAFPERTWTAVGVFDDGIAALPLLAVDSTVGGLLGGGAAAGWFRTVLAIHDCALVGPVSWAADTSLTLFEALGDKGPSLLDDFDSSVKVMKKVQSTWRGYHNPFAESDDEAVRVVLGDKAPFRLASGEWDRDFVRWTVEVWQPIGLVTPEER